MSKSCSDTLNSSPTTILVKACHHALDIVLVERVKIALNQCNRQAAEGGPWIVHCLQESTQLRNLRLHSNIRCAEICCRLRRRRCPPLRVARSRHLKFATALSLSHLLSIQLHPPS